MQKRLAVLILATVALAGGTAMVRAGIDCCVLCGRREPCRKVCRLVCEERKVETIVWGCQDVDFCIPGPGTPQGDHCEEIPGSGCQEGEAFSKPSRLFWRAWRPSDAEIFTRRKLMKKIVVRKVPSYRWVVEDLCAECKQVRDSVPASERGEPK